MEQKHVALVGILQDLGLYVNVVAKGDRLIAAKSGFDVRKLNEPRVLNAATTPKAKRGENVGDIDVSIASQQALTSVTWYITEDISKPLKEWQYKSGEKTRYTFEDKVAGITYHVCAEVFGSRSESVISPIATVVA